MKFEDFLLEQPQMHDDIDSNPKRVVREYEHQLEYNKDKFKEFGWGDYKIVFVNNHETIAFLLKDDAPIILTEYYVETTDKYDLFVNGMIQKGESKLPKNLIVEFMYECAKKLKCDGLLSGANQSKGGRKLWQDVLKFADSKGDELGIFDNINNKYEPKDSGVRLAIWQMRTNTTIYGKGSEKTKYQLYVKF